MEGLLDDFDDRVAALEEHLVEPTAEQLLTDAERMFEQEGDTPWVRMRFAAARSVRARERCREARLNFGT